MRMYLIVFNLGSGRRSGRYVKADAENPVSVVQGLYSDYQYDDIDSIEMEPEAYSGTWRDAFEDKFGSIIEVSL